MSVSWNHLSVLSLLCVLAAGCEDDGSAPSMGLDASLDGGLDPLVDAATDPARDAQARTCALDASYEYFREGSFGVFSYTSRLTAPSSYALEWRRTGGRVDCKVALPSCGSAVIDPEDLASAFAAPEVASALESGMTLYGGYSVPVDGIAFVLRRLDGGTLTVGDPCGSRPNCREIPESVNDVRRLLLNLDVQQTAGTPCQDIPR